MSERVQTSRARLNSIFFLYVLFVIAILLGAYAVFEARTNDVDRERPQAQVVEPITPDKAQAILDRANEASNFAGLLLSFIEASSAIIGVLLALGAYVLRRSIMEQFEQAIRTVDDMERRFKEREEALVNRERELADLRKTLTDRIRHLTDENRVEFEAIRAQARDSFRVVSLQLLAEQQVRAHNIETAIQTLSTAYDLEPDNQATNYLLGYLHTSRKDFDLAINHLERALAQDERFTPAIAALGLALRRKGDSIAETGDVEERNQLWSQAEANLLDALGLDPSLTDMDGESYYGTLGGLYRRQQRYPDALYAYERARDVTPASSYPIINLAALHTYQGDMENARRYFDMVLHNAELELDDDPRNMWTRMDYAQALLVLGKPDLALKELRTVIDQSPERGLLETVYSGLHFLSQSSHPIPGLDTLISELGAVLEALPKTSPPDEAGGTIVAGTTGV